MSAVVDMVNHPPHYTAHPSGVESVELCERLSFNLGNAVKYAWRCDNKGKRDEDLRKAAWYLRREAKRIKSVRMKPEVSCMARDVLWHEPPRTPLAKVLTVLRQEMVCNGDLEQLARAIEPEADGGALPRASAPPA